MRLICVVAMQAGLYAFAQAQGNLTIEKCLELATAQSPQLRIAENAQHEGELSLSELRTGALPQVKGSISASYVPIPPTFGYDPAISNGGQVAGLVVVQQSLFDGGIRSVRADQIQTDLGRLEIERRLAEQDLVASVKQAFIEGLRAQEEITLQYQGVNQLEAYADLVERLSRSGSVSYTDLLKTQLQASSARLALEHAIESFLLARTSLSELIGTPIDSSVHLEGSLEGFPGSNPDTLLMKGENDLRTNLDMKIASLSVERSLLDHDLASHERVPGVTVFGDAGYLNSGENLRVPAADRLNAFGYSIGIGIDIPIFNWGATSLRIQQRDLATEDLRQKMELLGRSLVADAQKSRLRLLKARERLAVLRANAKKAEENFLLTKARYAAGGTLALEVLTAQQLLTDLKLTGLQALADIRSLCAHLERLHIQ